MKSKRSPFGHSSLIIMTGVERVSAGTLTPYYSGPVSSYKEKDYRLRTNLTTLGWLNSRRSLSS